MLHFIRLHQWLETIAAAKLAAAFTEDRYRVNHHAHTRHPAKMVPHDGCYCAARSYNAAHLCHSFACFRHKVEDEQSECSVEVAVFEW